MALSRSVQTDTKRVDVLARDRGQEQIESINVMETEDEPQREASDPGTPADRLAALGRRREKTSRDGRAALAALSDPNFPLALLASVLLEPGQRTASISSLPMYLSAWHNSGVGLLLMSEPKRAYETAARALLAMTEQVCGVEEVPPVELAQAVARWSAPTPPGATKAHFAETCRDLAHHLAGLFSLPWPEP